MNFYEGGIFHIFNQGNNKRPIFLTDNNYEYFLWKMETYLLPFGDIISYCLMPNHFHIQFVVKWTELLKEDFNCHKIEKENNRKFLKFGESAYLKTPKEKNEYGGEFITLNQAIGIMQMSYSKALNKQIGWSGSVFRKRCKAKDGFIVKSVIMVNEGLSHNNSNYAAKCMNYIHENPVAANLIKLAIEYPWSSAKDYYLDLKDSICNLDLGRLITNTCVVESRLVIA